MMRTRNVFTYSKEFHICHDWAETALFLDLFRLRILTQGERDRFSQDMVSYGTYSIKDQLGLYGVANEMWMWGGNN